MRYGWDVGKRNGPAGAGDTPEPGPFFLPYAPECVEGDFSEVRGRLCDGELGGGRGAFYELFQIPHNPLRPLPGHRVASIGVHLEPRIEDRP